MVFSQNATQTTRNQKIHPEPRARLRKKTSSPRKKTSSPRNHAQSWNSWNFLIISNGFCWWRIQQAKKPQKKGFQPMPRICSFLYHPHIYSKQLENQKPQLQNLSLLQKGKSFMLENQKHYSVPGQLQKPCAAFGSAGNKPNTLISRPLARSKQARKSCWNSIVASSQSLAQPSGVLGISRTRLFRGPWPDPSKLENLVGNLLWLAPDALRSLRECWE